MDDSVEVGAGGCRRSWMCLAATSTGSTLPSPRDARGRGALRRLSLVVGSNSPGAPAAAQLAVSVGSWIEWSESSTAEWAWEALLRLSVAAKFAIGVATLGNSGAVGLEGGKSSESSRGSSRLKVATPGLVPQPTRRLDSLSPWGWHGWSG